MAQRYFDVPVSCRFRVKIGLLAQGGGNLALEGLAKKADMFSGETADL